jgi:hypothetical protein
MKPSDPTGFCCTYIFPIRRVQVDRTEILNLAIYFRLLRSVGCEVLVVDGSAAAIFEAHHETWKSCSRHVRPDPEYRYLNGKVNGVQTGVDLASCERIIVADDDIRYRAADLKRMCRLLNDFEVVRPQNFLSPLPWWARIESARILINRGVLATGDYPGTCGFRRATMRRVGPYDGDVLFDNEEMIRHFAVHNANIKYAVDFFILKRPPTFKKWMEQRPRQAYEDFVMRTKTIAFASLLPTVCALIMLGKVAAAFYVAIAISLLSAALASKGLLRNAAYKFFPITSTLFAPLWILERAFSVYWALYWRLRFGGYPFGERLLSKGTGRAWLAGGRIQSQSFARSDTGAGVENG